MENLSIFKNMKKEEINAFLNGVGARRIHFKKDELIFSKLNENVLTGIIIFGNASIVKYDNKGNRVIIDYLEADSIFGRPFIYEDDVSIIASSESLILFIDYDLLVANPLICINLIDVMSYKMYKIHERIELLSKKTIREKLLNYFYILSIKEKSKTFNIPITYIELSDFLSIDRSAMMRELKRLKNEKIILLNGKEITLENVESINMNML